MADVEQLLKGTVHELDRLLNAKNVLGDPIVSYGFGFGAGGSSGGKSGDGAGTGGGGGIKPLGAIIIDGEGARVEAVQGAMTTLAEVIRDTAARAIESQARRNSNTE